MKILFNNSNYPAPLAHGGLQVQIEQTMAALREIGVEVEELRWWDENQRGDVLHHFGRIPFHHVELAHQKGMKVVFSDFLGNVAARPRRKIALQSVVIRVARALIPAERLVALSWLSYQTADTCFVLTPAEEALAIRVFGAPPNRVKVIPNGVEEVFFKSANSARGDWLVCTATIRDIKRVTELASAAVEARTPVWIIGKPYAETDAYAQRFLTFVRENSKFVRFEGPIENREKLAQVYRQARGFVLLSAYESLSLSALEAAACECPLLLSDLPWARSVFKEGAKYCPVAGRSETAAVLRKFYEAAPYIKHAEKPMTWLQVAQQLRGLYETILNQPRS
jgi:glycosyltransferase involved in cell wall biosynthesis